MIRRPQIQDQESKGDARAQRRRQLPTFYPELIIKAACSKTENYGLL
ncbi:hypothetical protein IVB18_40945 [Bradyrhizobium sp. 186]|nr:hypothetical protein [Bradyrhizobium sp. 186]UPK34418.1 hypothetical protein IVB18_40945 [Bradyrhizobium sp. 186]